HIGTESVHVEGGVDLAPVRDSGFLVAAYADGPVPLCDQCRHAAHVGVILHLRPCGPVARILRLDTERMVIAVPVVVHAAGVPAPARGDHVPGAIKAEAELCEWSGESGAAVA